MRHLLGYLTLLGAAAAYGLHLRASFLTHGGRLGQDPCVAAAAIQVPLLTLLGLSLLETAAWMPDWSWWVWPLVWLAQTLFVTGTALWIGELGYRRAAGQ